MDMVRSLCVLALLSLMVSVAGFSPGFNPGRITSTNLHATMKKEDEAALRQELESKNSVVENEERYGLLDGEGMALVDDNETPKQTKVETTSQNDARLEKKIDRMLRPRAYPLFLAEKAAEFFENTFKDVMEVGSSAGVQASSTGTLSSGTKEKIVVLGTGWGAASFLKDINSDIFDVTVISPRNYFLFTPMLAGASVGTVEYRSITEPIREINRKVNFLEAIATSIDLGKNEVSCQSVVCDGNSCAIEDFVVTFDRLLVSIGAQTNTFGIPGVREYCCFLRQVEDARRIRTAIVNCFERANLPSLSDEERINNLTFAVIGAGPTGVEFAAELRDFVEEDGPKYYPHLLKHVRIKVIEASSTVLAPFDRSLQDEAIKQLRRKVAISNPDVTDLLPENFQLTELLLDSSVKEVKENVIMLNDGSEIHYGLSVWAAGNGPLPLTLQLIDALGEEQANEQGIARGRLAIDPWLRVFGGRGKVLSLGDCSCITKAQLPATAQVASQQGEYLADLLNKNYNLSPDVSNGGIFQPPTRDPQRQETSLSEAIAGFATQSAEYARPFQFLNLGILAYTGGGSALAQISLTPDAGKIKGSGALGNTVWRSVYLSKQVSWRNRLLVLNDWTKRQIFGRDITRI